MTPPYLFEDGEDAYTYTVNEHDLKQTIMMGRQEKIVLMGGQTLRAVYEHHLIRLLCTDDRCAKGGYRSSY
jgi:hypothetical protein